jgi:hypothetical protein
MDICLLIEFLEHVAEWQLCLDQARGLITLFAPLCWLGHVVPARW